MAEHTKKDDATDETKRIMERPVKMPHKLHKDEPSHKAPARSNKQKTPPKRG